MMKEMKTLTIDSETYEVVDGKAREDVNELKETLEEHLNNHPSGGLGQTASDLLIEILRNGVYTTNQNENITALVEALKATDTEGGGGEPEKVYYSITSNLTNVTNSNANTQVLENSSYIANLTATVDYVIDSVTVTMGGTDITSSAYANGVITINSVTGDIVITANATLDDVDPITPNFGTLVYDFDFTHGLTDSVAGKTAVLNGSATQDSEGLHINDQSSYAHICNDIAVGNVVELELGECSDKNTTHSRFVMTCFESELSNIARGFIYRNTGAWGIYNTVWSEDTTITDRNYFANKTLALTFEPDITKIYVDGNLDYTISMSLVYGNNLFIGSGSQSLCPLTVKKLRVYRKGV